MTPLPWPVAPPATRPVAVMIHGAGGGGWEYRFWRPVFESAGYRVIAPDLKPTSKGLAATTFDDYVAQIVRASGPRPAVMIGASMGSVLVLKAAEKVRPRALVLVCGATPAGIAPPAKAPGPKAKPYPPIIRWKNGPYADTVASMPDSDEATRRFAHPRWRDESGAVLNALAAGVRVARPTVPVLVVIPEADDTVAPERQRAVARWAGADTHAYARMSHVGPLLSRRAREVARSVVGWLRSRER